MSDARWQRLQELFDELVGMPAAARIAWLARTDADPDADLKREALALVEAEPRAGMTGKLREIAEQLAPCDPVNLRLGPYRLIAEIGSGGMGTVFLAERVDENFDQRVAIKLLRGIPTRESTERMRRERQILADLSHPHIARLIDGGSTTDGQPYLVMEYVDGQPLNEYCRAHEGSLASRVHLLQKICGAVQYAHQRLVIHRDLKPANVLVRADGEPVLLDFGIAKLLSDTNAPTQQTGLTWFTPAYASPEQCDGKPVSTASDVYGLGRLLQEMVNDHLAVVPQTAVTTMGRRRIPADLQLIIAKATHAEPERRYASASALAEDLQRLLRKRPIHAAPDRLHYRMRKFIGRHRLSSAAIAAILVMAVVFTWRLTRERDRALRAEVQARHQSATAESVVDYLVSLFRSASPNVAGTRLIAPRELVDRGRKEIDTRLAQAPQQRARLLGALGKIYLELGLPDAAAEALGSAAALERDNGSSRQRAAYLAEQGFALNLAERPDAAEPALQAGVAALGVIAPQDRKLAAEILSTLGIAQARRGDAMAGIASARRALVYAAQFAGEDSVPYAQCLYALAETHMRAGRFADAETQASRSLDLMRQHLPEDASEVLSATGFLTDIYEQQGRYAEGERLLRHMLEVRLHTLDPGSAWAVTVRNNLAQTIQLQGRIVEATGLLRENVDLLSERHQEDSPAYVISVNNLASLLEQAGDYPAAIRMFTDVLRDAERQSKTNDPPRLPMYRQNLGRSLMLDGQLAAARPLLDQPIEDEVVSKDVAAERARRLLHLAEWMRRSARFSEALEYANQASHAFIALYPDMHARHGAVARTRALILRDQHCLAEAEAEMRRAATVFATAVGKDANSTIDAELQLAEILFERGNHDEARSLHSRLEPLLPGRFVEGSSLRHQYAELRRKFDNGNGVARGG